jgi:hypothetical protein
MYVYLCICVCICTYICMFVYMYTHRNSKRERSKFNIILILVLFIVTLAQLTILSGVDTFLLLVSVSWEITIIISNSLAGSWWSTLGCSVCCIWRTKGCLLVLNLHTKEPSLGPSLPTIPPLHLAVGKSSSQNSALCGRDYPDVALAQYLSFLIPQLDNVFQATVQLGGSMSAF